MIGADPIGKDDAKEMIRAASWTDEETGRTTIHSFVHGASIALGADHTIENAIGEIDEADEIAWVAHPLGHDLAVRCGPRVVYFAVKRPPKCAFSGCGNLAGATVATGVYNGEEISLAVCDDHAEVVARGALTAISLGGETLGFVEASDGGLDA